MLQTFDVRLTNFIVRDVFE